jgi:hypothetical protein
MDTKKFCALVALALTVVACSGSNENPQPQPEPTTTNGGDRSVDECPRADGTPCR